MKDNAAKIERSHIEGNFVQGDTRGNIEYRKVENQYGNQLREPQRTLAEAAKEIQELLQQLEKTNPSATDAEKIAYVSDETTPKFKRRVVGALKAGGEVAIEEFLDNPYVNIVKATVKGWFKPE